MSAIVKNGDNELQRGQAQLQTGAVAFLVEKIASLDKETKDDLAEVFMDLRNCASDEDLREIEQTIQEILFPHTAGKLLHGNDLPEGISPRLEEWLKSVGGKIKRLREDRGLTQKDLADLSGLRQSHISRLETGQHSPSHKTLCTLAGALGVKVCEIDPASPASE